MSSPAAPPAPAIRAATPADLPDIQAIYAHHVLHGTGTFEEIPPSLEELTIRFHAITQAGHVWLVAPDATGLRGYGYYGPFRARSAYRFTVEDSIYIREDARGQGLGKALLDALITQARTQNLTQMLALIGDSDNHGSIALHQAAGFTHTGTLKAVGQKFNRWLNVVTMQLTL
jgi:L-amino acid N-acyltransferase YncA